MGIVFGSPRFVVPKKEIKESEFKLESNYIHDHIKSVASEMISKFSGDNTGIVYKLYKEIADGKVANPLIIVSKNPHSSDIASYDEQNKKIVVWEHHLKNIEKDNDKKIKLVSGLAISYGRYINILLKDSLNPKDNLETYDYDLFKFDALGDAVVTIAKLESPNYNGNLEISFPKEETEKPQTNHYRQDKNTRGGPNPGDFDDYENSSASSGPGDPPLNMGLKFSFSLNGGFTASLYAGISKEVARAGDLHLMPSLNAALTYYGYGAPGTSSLSRNLFNATLTPAVTLGVKTGNSLNMNLFTSFTGSGVNNPYEYAFTVGSTGVLSSGKVTNTHDEKGNKIKNSERERDEYNSQDNPNRNQIVGGASIKVGNFMISSYNDIYKLPLFLGMDSDQYWSAGVNMQAKLTDKISMAYAFDLYYGKSNNKNPFSLDKIIERQNYDHQRLFDVLLNRGQETFSFTDADGNLNTSTKFGYGTFWPSNMMHNTIAFPEDHSKLEREKKPVRSDFNDDNSYNKALEEYKSNPTFNLIPSKEPKKPIRADYKNDETFDKDKTQYDKDLIKYKDDKRNYEISTNLKSSPTFHHLFVVYKEDSKKADLERLKTYLEAEIPTKAKLLQEFYKLDKENKAK